MAEFNALSALGGGLLIGLASTLMLIGLGRIAGISGILGGLLAWRQVDAGWRAAFLGGLVLGGLLFGWASGYGLSPRLQTGWTGMLTAGLLVGFGTRLGSGCTSGHGVCGIARLSPRSIVATVTFMATAGVTVYITHHLLG